MSTTRNRPSTRIGIAAILVSMLVLTACDAAGDQEEPSASPAQLAQGEPTQFRVLVDNIEYGGGPATDEAMRVVDADVVGVLESYNRLPEIAEETGYPYYNVALQILSKYPIHEASGADGLYALIEVQPGYVVAFFNVHLDYVERGRNLMLDGMSVADAIENENEVRTSALEVQFDAMTSLIDQGVPVFLTGDFNQPSSLDYTAETIGTRKGIDEVVPWPVSEALFDLGFRDAYREIFPDPVATPGITHDKAGDRIDYTYAAGPSTTLDTQMVGEEGGPDVDIELSKWGSDHRAVVSDFDVTPVAMPTMVSVNARLQTVGDVVTISYNAPGSDTNQIAIVPEGGDLTQPERTIEASDERGSVTLDTADLDPTGYEAVLVDADGAELARVTFWLRELGAEVSLTTDQPTYGSGDPITVNWEDGPANRWDWIGVYRAQAPDPEEDDYLLWAYTGLHASGTVPPSVAGSLTLDADSQGGPWPLPPGDYVVHYLLTDEYTSAGSAEFTVTG